MVVRMVWWSQKGNFDVADKEDEGASKKLLNEDPTQTEQQLANKVNATQPIISNSLDAIGKIPKLGKLVTYKLKEMNMERQKQLRNPSPNLTGVEKWIYTDFANHKHSLIYSGQPSTSQPNRVGHLNKTLLCTW